MKSTKSLTFLFTVAFALAVTAAIVPGSVMAQAPTVQEVQAQETSWTGTVEQKEIGGMKTYVLTVGGQSYLLEPQDKAADFVGKTVTITGKADGNTVVISSIKEA